MEDYGLTIKPCIPAYQVVFDDGDRVDVGFPRQGRLSPNELEALEKAERGSRAKMDSIEKDGSVKWDAYLQACEAFLDCGLPNFIEEKLDLGSFPAFLRESLRDFGKAWPLKPHSDVLDVFFESDKLRALASFQDLYVGLEPYRNEQQIGGGILDSTAPAVFGLLAAIELHPRNEKCGVYAPVGGFQSVANSLHHLAEDCGVTCCTGQRVTKVSSEGVWYQDAKERSDELDRVTSFEPADLVIVNADLPYTTESLMRDDGPEKEVFDWNDEYRFSSGVIAFHWSVNKTLSELNTHNVFLSTKSRKDAEDSWVALRDGSKSQSLLRKDTPFNFYVHRASTTDPTAAPEVRPEVATDSIILSLTIKPWTHTILCKGQGCDYGACSLSNATEKSGLRQVFS
jgi:phytoene desaturase (3,4-didehydrolycopene-forming)